MISYEMEEIIQEKWQGIESTLNERQRRLWLAAEATSLGHGGIRCVSRATGVAQSTIWHGLMDLEQQEAGEGLEAGRVRRPGGGRQKLIERHPKLLKNLKSLVESTTRGDPEAPLLWTTKSLRNLGEALAKKLKLKKVPSPSTVSSWLRELGYSLQANRKKLEGKQHPDRNAQFEYINDIGKEFLEADEPWVSIDTKKKEQVGQFSRPGREYRRRKKPVKTLTHDFPSLGLGKAIPYGVYDVGDNSGFVSIGIDHDTAEFAVETLLAWWKKVGRKRYPKAKELLITADCGGSNSPRGRLWRCRIQEFVDRTNLVVYVSHFPPGTSKWNKIEHRMFSHITLNWRGRPLVSYETIIKLIGNTTTKKGLTIKAQMDYNEYPTGIEVPDEIIESLNIERNEFHGEWNYTVYPRDY